MTTSSSEHQKIQARAFAWLSGIWRLEVLVPLAGAILFFLGSAEILGGLARTTFASMQDPVFGISFGHVMLIFGLAQVCVAFLCLFTNRKVLSLSLVAWLSMIFVVYRAGLWSLGWYYSSGFKMTPIGISLTDTDIILSLSSFLLLVVSLSTLWNEYRAKRSAKSVKMSCPSCGVHVKFSIQDLGRSIACPKCQKTFTLRRPGNLKMSCFFCKGNIEFPSHALGEKMSCPHCEMDITLKVSV